MELLLLSRRSFNACALVLLNPIIFAVSMSYLIKTPHFEGPFDLILFFIERDELDIYDIPITSITADYLEYIRKLESLNVDVASEFVLVAATLMRIKAKMLIPRKQLDESGEEIDPRSEFVGKLLEYKRFKEVVDAFKAKEALQARKVSRGNVQNELKILAQKALVDVELETLNLFKLMHVFHGLLDRLDQDKEKIRHAVFDYEYTIEAQREYIFQLFSKHKRLNFKATFAQVNTRVEAIVTFLALLDLLSQQEIKITQGEGVNNFWIERKLD